MSSDKKNNPTGIRFNEEKLNFVKEKENLNTPQKVVNFLLDRYWWENKFGAAPKINPVDNRSDRSENKLSASTYEPKQEKLPTVFDLLNEMSELEYPEEYAAMGNKIQDYTHLSKKEKDNLLQNLKMPRM